MTLHARKNSESNSDSESNGESVREPGEGPELLIETRGLSYRFPHSEAPIELPDLELAPGESVCLVGPSGSGKTTLLNLVSGIYLPTTGTVTLLGRSLGQLTECARARLRLAELGLIFQEFELLDYLTLRRNLGLTEQLRVSRPFLRTDTSTSERIQTVASALGLKPLLERKPRHISQGERQRVGIGRALIGEPKVLLADEPTGNLDRAHRTAVIDLLLDETRTRRAGLIFVTHDTFVTDRFDRVLDLGEVRP